MNLLPSCYQFISVSEPQWSAGGWEWEWGCWGLDSSRSTYFSKLKPFNFSKLKPFISSSNSSSSSTFSFIFGCPGSLLLQVGFPAESRGYSSLQCVDFLLQWLLSWSRGSKTQRLQQLWLSAPELRFLVSRAHMLSGGCGPRA